MESVGILSHRKEILSALFLLAALRLSLSSRMESRALAAASLVAAVFSKETAVLFPALWLLLERHRTGGARNGGPNSAPGPRLLPALAGWTALSALLAALAWVQIRHGMAVLHAAPALDPDRAGHFPGGAPWGPVCSAALRAFPRYLSGLVVPWGHSIDPAFRLDVPFLSLRTGAAATIWIAYAAGLLALARRRSPLFTPLAWIPAVLLPYLLPPLLRSGGTAAFCDRYAYLAAAGAAWLLAEALRIAAARTGLRGRARTASVCLLAALFAGCTLAEALDYRSETDFWRRASRWNPKSFQSRFNLGYALWMEEGSRREARTEFERMRALRPGFAFGMAGYADFLSSGGQDDEALDIVAEGLRHRPGNPLLLRKRAAVLLHAGRFSSALRACRDAESAGADSASFQFVFAEACRNCLLWPEALARYRRAADADPSYRRAADRNAILISDPEPPLGAMGLVVAGDSVPHGSDALGPGRNGRPLAARLAERLGGIPFTDASVPGSLADEVARGDLLPDSFENPPRWFVVMTGHNDAFRGVPAPVILHRIAESAYRARSSGMRVLVVGPIPVESVPGRNRKRQKRTLEELDRRLSAFCASARIHFLSSRQGLAETTPPPGGWLVAERGNHLVDAGLDRIADLCATAVRTVEANPPNTPKHNHE